MDTIIQEYIPGCEFGVFYYRRPDEQHGRIFSITEKRFPEVIGDGARNLERLILDDERAVCMALFYMAIQSERLMDVPKHDERVQLVEIGTHSRGAIFLDGGWVKTPQLEIAIDEISRGFEGFYFGQYDVRTASVQDFKAGRNFKVHSCFVDQRRAAFIKCAAYRAIKLIDSGSGAFASAHNNIRIVNLADSAKAPPTEWLCGLLIGAAQSKETKAPSTIAARQDSARAGERTHQLINEIVKASYPDLNGTTIRIKVFHSKSDYFKARFGIPQFFFARMRYLVVVNPLVFELQAPEAGVRAIIAHELAHVVYFKKRNRVRLLGSCASGRSDSPPSLNDGQTSRPSRWVTVKV